MGEICATGDEYRVSTTWKVPVICNNGHKYEASAVAFRVGNCKFCEKARIDAARSIVRSEKTSTRTKLGQFEAKYPTLTGGERFNFLTVTRESILAGKRTAECVCDCGKVVVTTVQKIQTGHTKSCKDCGHKRGRSKVKDYFGYADIIPDDNHRRRLMNRIAAQHNRCENPNSAEYHSYGARGIRMHPEWLTPEGKRQYLSYLTTLDGWDNAELELDRIDNNKGYQPGNLRFTDRKTNANNKRTVQKLEQENEQLKERIRYLERRS